MVLVIWTATVAAAGPREAASVGPPVELREVTELLEPGLISPPGRLRAGRRSLRKATTVQEAIDVCVRSDMALFDASGAAVAVILDGELLYERGYGEKLRYSNEPVDPGTIFRIGPVTQQMTAAALMRRWNWAGSH